MLPRAGQRQGQHGSGFVQIAVTDRLHLPVPFQRSCRYHQRASGKTVGTDGCIPRYRRGVRLLERIGPCTQHHRVPGLRDPAGQRQGLGNLHAVILCIQFRFDNDLIQPAGCFLQQGRRFGRLIPQGDDRHPDEADHDRKNQSRRDHAQQKQPRAFSQGIHHTKEPVFPSRESICWNTFPIRLPPTNHKATSVSTMAMGKQIILAGSSWVSGAPVMVVIILPN